MSDNQVSSSEIRFEKMENWEPLISRIIWDPRSKMPFRSDRDCRTSLMTFSRARAATRSGLGKFVQRDGGLRSVSFGFFKNHDQGYLCQEPGA